MKQREYTGTEPRKVGKKTQIAVIGTVSGFMYEGETEEEAQVRLVLEAEMSANESKARLHLSIDTSLHCREEDQETCPHNIIKTARCEQCVSEGVYTFAEPK